MKITICVGSTCHLLGSKRVVDKFKELVSEHHLDDKVELAGKFCMGKCGEGVCVTIDGVTVHCENFCEESGEIFEIAAAENVRLIGVTAQSNAKNKNLSVRISAAKNIEINGEKFFGDATANL